MELEEVIEIATSAGEMLLSNGAEAYRVEETVDRICSSYGMNGECISTSTGIYITVSSSGMGMATSVKRIRQRQIDLYKVELINSFSRNLVKNPMSYEEAKKTLDDINNTHNFSLGVRLMAACLSSFIYTIFFNGTIYDALVSAAIGFGIYLMTEKMSRFGNFQFLQYYLSGFVIGAVSFAVQHLIPVINKDNVIIGAIIMLLPGVIMTNGIKDMLYGDFVSGIAKLGEAVLIMIAMAVGIGTSLSLCMKWML